MELGVAWAPSTLVGIVDQINRQVVCGDFSEEVMESVCVYFSSRWNGFSCTDRLDGINVDEIVI